MGCIFLFFVLNKKNTRCTYFPNDRVLNNLRSKPFYYSNVASKELAEDWLDTIDVKNTLEYGDVDFSRSNLKISKGKLYTIIGKTIKNQPIEVIVENYEDKVVLKEVKKQ
ncbi:hypothetical protein FPN187_contig00015-0004 [Flavobacterium psychrophilum]|nr:hypothetical protein FPN187_contig00015-0004 [Flavobacterium psychrophilum]GEJ36585.1 hypothetical protein FPN182_contig00013-0004 [Flavobacterium psychrophilum]GEJ42693.1 hypothetical protein FPN185_contig00024-0004 [Flavobacterium psychrophilum]GEJ53647.1 hypothetical protein FPKHI175_contig00023-0096 [Flavobacterium psychrophilum]